MTVTKLPPEASPRTFDTRMTLPFVPFATFAVRLARAWADTSSADWTLATTGERIVDSGVEALAARGDVEPRMSPVETAVTRTDLRMEAGYELSANRRPTPCRHHPDTLSGKCGADG